MTNLFHEFTVHKSCILCTIYSAVLHDSNLVQLRGSFQYYFRLLPLTSSSMLSSSTVEAQFDKQNPLRLVRQASEEERDDEELLLEQDIEGSRPKPRRNKVKLDFDSDSDEEGQVNVEGDDDDMFADTKEPAESIDTAEKTKKKSRFLDINAFESNLNQMEPSEQRLLQTGETRDEEMNGEGVDSDEDDDDDDEVTETNADVKYFLQPDEEEEYGPGPFHKVISAKKHEPKIEGFSLKDDMEEGQFDEQGNFIRNLQDTEAHQDQWLAGVNKREIKKARAAHLHRLEEEKQHENSKEVVPKSDLLSKLIEHLEIGENPLEAMARLSPKKAANKRKNQKHDHNHSDGEKYRKKTVEVITEYCELLLEQGVTDVYELYREELSRLYQKETGEPYVYLKRKRDDDNGNDQSDERQWEFKWQGSDEIHGPYSSRKMADWVKYDYFDSRTRVREFGKSEFVGVGEVEWL